MTGGQVLLIAAAYAIGSVPFAYLLARLAAGVDVRTVGSGNVGATNVLRHAHPGVALAVLLLDMAKGAAAVWLGRRAGAAPAIVAAMAIASIVGHIHPVWLRFAGGKGVATACGAFALLAPSATLLACALFAIIVWVSRIVSLGSLTGAIALVAGAWAFGSDGPVLTAACVTAALIGWGHRENVTRLLAGTERRLGG